MNIHQMLLKMTQSVWVWMQVGRCRIPGEKDGIYAGRTDAGLEEQRRKIDGHFEIKLEACSAFYKNQLLEGQAAHQKLEKETDALCERRRELGNPCHSLPMLLVLILFALIGIGAEVAVMIPLTQMFYVTTPQAQLLLAIALVSTPATALHVALRQIKGGVFDHRYWRTSIGVMSFGMISGLVWFRFKQLGWAANPTFKKAFAENALGVLAVLLLAATLLTVVVTYAMCQLEQSSDIWRLRRRIERQKKKLQKLEAGLAVGATNLEHDRSMLMVGRAIAIASFERGVAIGRKTAKVARWTEVIFHGLDIRKAGLLTAGLLSGAFVVGLVVTLFASRLLPGTVALFVGLISVVGVSSVGIFRILPLMGKEDGAQLEPKTNDNAAGGSWWRDVLLDGLDVRKTLLLTIGLVSGALILGLFATLFVVKAGLPGTVALFVGVLSATCFSSWRLYRSLPGLKNDDGLPGPSGAKRFVPVAASITAVILLAIIMTSCSGHSVAVTDKAVEVVSAFAGSAAEQTEDRAIVVGLDVSKSVRATDEQLCSATLSVLAHAHRGDTVIVIPILDHAGDVLSISIPTKREPFDGDLIELYRKSAKDLRTKLPRWRSEGGAWSDYQNAFVLGGELLAKHSKRIMIVLGDMVDDQSPQMRDRSPRPPLVPELNGTSLSKTQAYVGFVSSQELDRLSKEDRHTFEANWGKELSRRGVSSVEIRAFGFQGLENWLEDVLGPASRNVAAVVAEEKVENVVR